MAPKFIKRQRGRTNQFDFWGRILQFVLQGFPQGPAKKIGLILETGADDDINQAVKRRIMK